MVERDGDAPRLGAEWAAAARLPRAAAAASCWTTFSAYFLCRSGCAIAARERRMWALLLLLFSGRALLPAPHYAQYASGRRQGGEGCGVAAALGARASLHPCKGRTLGMMTTCAPSPFALRLAMHRLHTVCMTCASSRKTARPQHVRWLSPCTYLRQSCCTVTAGLLSARGVPSGSRWAAAGRLWRGAEATPFYATPASRSALRPLPRLPGEQRAAASNAPTRFGTARPACCSAARGSRKRQRYCVRAGANGGGNRRRLPAGGDGAALPNMPLAAARNLGAHGENGGDTCVRAAIPTIHGRTATGAAAAHRQT